MKKEWSADKAIDRWTDLPTNIRAIAHHKAAYIGKSCSIQFCWNSYGRSKERVYWTLVVGKDT